MPTLLLEAPEEFNPLPYLYYTVAGVVFILLLTVFRHYRKMYYDHVVPRLETVNATTKSYHKYMRGEFDTPAQEGEEAAAAQPEAVEKPWPVEPHDDPAPPEDTPEDASPDDPDEDEQADGLLPLHGLTLSPTRSKTYGRKNFPSLGRR